MVVPCNLLVHTSTSTQQARQTVLHHLTFDAGILFNEMGRCGMTDTAEKFVKIVRAGLCTMDPQDAACVRRPWL